MKHSAAEAVEQHQRVTRCVNCGRVFLHMMPCTYARADHRGAYCEEYDHCLCCGPLDNDLTFSGPTRVDA